MKEIILIICSFIVVQTLILNFIKRDRIGLIGNFFQKVMPTIPFSKILGYFKKKPPKDREET